MFSFFKKKTPEVSPSEEIPIPGPDLPQNPSENNEFVFVEHKPQGINQPFPTDPNNRYMYPPLPGSQYFPPNVSQTSGPINNTVVNNLDGVPFNLSPAISTENSFEIQQSNVDHILATITRTISIDESKEYNFALERSILGI